VVQDPWLLGVGRIELRRFEKLIIVQLLDLMNERGPIRKNLNVSDINETEQPDGDIL
jgi:hypothetical protein